MPFRTGRSCAVSQAGEEVLVGVTSTSGLVCQENYGRYSEVASTYTNMLDKERLAWVHSRIHPCTTRLRLFAE